MRLGVGEMEVTQLNMVLATMAYVWYMVCYMIKNYDNCVDRKIKTCRL